MADEFEKIITMRGAYDKRHPAPAKNYGIHGMDIKFVLKGPLGAVQFLVFTGMHLPHVAQELWEKGGTRNSLEPMGADIGYHSPHPMFEGQETMECDLLPEGKCYYDGSTLQADEFMPTFLEGGSDAVWAMLESRYRELFEPQSTE